MLFNRWTYHIREIATQGREGGNARAHKRGGSRAVGKEAAETADAQRGGRGKQGRSARSRARGAIAESPRAERMPTRGGGRARARSAAQRAAR